VGRQRLHQLLHQRCGQWGRRLALTQQAAAVLRCR
jgi:hypothetical protein